ncbi:MAG: TetR/AcrR family transcriptional regulator [Candidatus Binatus sp.]|uniref:TetR/AcrR family transcriptional regulator n=1 Tax=Candidatus Binatus sp. TaxID=2811406 RepID=UPI0027264C33|nr:TetR/AcrR family transcriptional regulator [Candidatus Binatus sp.]MDO8434350.1 TetR/AcrR family transcriptional regulator [Candidatus Binatus sp.]
MPAVKIPKRLAARRVAIVDALKRCMVTQGYADTSLSDLARTAGISVSHFLYYYPSKDAVLIDLCSELLDKAGAEITAAANEPPEERIHVLVDHLFVRAPVAQGDLGMVQELISLSLHRPAVRRRMSEFHHAMMAYLTDLFEKVPRQPGVTAVEAANIAAALWQGLFTNSLYATDLLLDEGRGRQLYRRALFGLANIRDADSGALVPNLGNNILDSPEVIESP